MAATLAQPARAGWWVRNQRQIIPYLYIAPFFILFAIFGIYPIIASFYLSLFHGLGLGPKAFYGLGNYTFLLTDSRYLHAFWNTVYWTLASVFVLSPLALLLAMALQSIYVRHGWRDLYRIVFFLPVVTSAVIIAVIFEVVFSSPNGLLDQALGSLGPLRAWDKIDWLRNTSIVMGWSWLQPVLAWPIIGAIIKSGTIVWNALFLMNIWTYLGINALYWTAGLNSVDTQLYEAASIDGANRWQRFWGVTWPLLRPMTLFVVIQAVVGSMGTFAQPFLLTGGGPSDATMTLALYQYTQGFSIANFPYANAIGYSMAIITLLLSLLNFWLFRERDEPARA